MVRIVSLPDEAIATTPNKAVIAQ